VVLTDQLGFRLLFRAVSLAGSHSQSGLSPLEKPSLGIRLRRWGQCVGLLFVLASAVLAASFWDEKPPEQWSLQEARRLLIDSPWAKFMTVRLNWEGGVPRGPTTWKELGIPGSGPAGGGSPRALSTESPVGGLGAPRRTYPHEARVILRWVSARPLRYAEQIESRRQQAAAGSQPASGPTFGAEEQRDYVLELVGLPAIVAHRGTSWVEAELARTTVFRTKRRPLIRPEAVETEIRGLYLAIRFRVSREERITLEDEFIECSGETSLFRFQHRFDLRKMVWRGELEL